MSLTETTTADLVQPEVEAGESLIFQCGQWALAIDLALVERIVPIELLRPVKAKQQLKIAAGFCGLVQADRVHYALWDVGEILGQASEQESIVLLRITTAKGESLPIALRVGRCLAVGPLPRRGLSALPTKLTKKRQGAFDLAFDHSKVHGVTSEISGGLRLNLQQLWSQRETTRTLSLLNKAAAPHGGE